MLGIDSPTKPTSVVLSPTKPLVLLTRKTIDAVVKTSVS